MLRCGDIHPNPGPPKPFSFCHLNAQSLLSGVDLTRHIPSQQSKLDEIYSVLAIERNFDVIAITETWLTPCVHSEDIKLEGYQLPFRTDRQGRGGGSLIYVKSTLPAIRCKDLELGPCECTWIEMNIQNNLIYFGVYYRSPGQTAVDREDFLLNLQSSLDLIYRRNPFAIICTGDFNDRCSNWNDKHNGSDLGTKLYDLVNNNNLFQLIDEPTRITETCQSLLDLIITDSPGHFSDWGTEPSVADHMLVYGTLHIHIDSGRCFTRYIWHYKNADFEGLNRELNNIDWEGSFHNLPDLQKATRYLTVNIKAVAMKYIPYKRIKINPKDKPWMTSYIKYLIRIRNRYSRMFRRTKSHHHRLLRNQYRNLVKREIQDCKLKYYQRQSEILSISTIIPKRYWTLVKKLDGN